ncbi:nucleosome assembly protein 1-like 1 isoform X2 [Ahaetulla prasina]|uniref:nucleosome assembly protein 1-like 1 isoform X2 n=1 Tax=Ahaetulla prasina TaxID=499056 RepID=UPI0026486C07|nr:nucleosome assembly protein 1-like 1 isoform X2 [Ahaetulla prasina]
MADIDNKEQAELDQQDMEDVEEVEEEESGEDANSKARQLTVQMMQNPQILAALQERLDGLVGTPTGYIESCKVVSDPSQPHGQRSSRPSCPLPSSGYGGSGGLHLVREVRSRCLRVIAHSGPSDFSRSPSGWNPQSLDLRLMRCNASLPKVVKRRVNALKNLQVKCAQIEAKFYEEVHELERKYATLYQPLFDKRSEIINAVYEPTEEECEWKTDAEEEISEMKEKAKLEEEKKDQEKDDPKGIPEFWLTVFKNVDLLSDMVQEHDEPILKHLKDIKVKFSEAGEPMTFTLEFHFEPNEFFTNEVVTKTYRMRSEPDDSDPFSFDGPEIMGCTGCQIDWKKGKNVTLKTIKKKQKHKGRGTVRTVTKTVSNDSFFNFFSPPEVPESGDLDDDAEAILAADFEIGHFLRERIVPRSVLYFTGEAIEDDDDDYDEEGEEADDEEGEEEADEENDPDYDPKKDQNPAECKQQ